MADSRTLLSAATLFMFGELTLDLLFRDAARIELCGDLASHCQVQLPADFDRDLRGIAEWI